uniref:hypothetical protein n=1 Tax=Acetatifactor sp. TaxID=1872090 RepID=UPI004057028B
MFKQIRILTKLELCNLFGMNVYRHIKDKTAKKKAFFLLAVYGILILLLWGYMGGLSYGLYFLGLAKLIPAYLITIASLLIFFLGIFKAGSIIFQPNGYDILCSLPVTRTAVVVSRFLRMYVENLALGAAVLLPGIMVYAWFETPSLSFYITAVPGILFLPLLPLTAATFIGALITGISSRMKHKSLVSSGLCMLVILAIMLGCSQLASLESTLNMDMLKELSVTISTLLEQLYPPAAWLGNAIVAGDFIACLSCCGLFFVLFTVVVALIAANFHSICRMLYSTTAKHNYKMETLTQNSILVALCKRELKRYFSSSVYVTNTIIGPIMGTIAAGAFLFVDMESITKALPISLNLQPAIPIFMASVFCMMTTTATSISMEGKNWWIVRTLPLSTKQILDAKIAMNLILVLPFYLIAEVLLCIALKPGGLAFLWQLTLPAIIICFSCVYGITINLIFPVLNWDNETSVVKQSASSLIGGMGGFLFALLCAVPVMLVPESYSHLVRLGIGILFSVLTLILYRKNNLTKLPEA